MKTLGFVPDGSATDGVDYGYDAPMPDVFDDDMCWIIEDDYYSIQGVGAFDNLKQYPLGVFLASSGTIKIAMQGQENFDEEVDVFIYDSLYGTYTLINNDMYEIALDAGEYLNRFYIAFDEEETLSIVNNEDSNVLLSYLNDTDEIYINTLNALIVEKVELITILGQEVLQVDDLENNTSNGIIRIAVENPLALGNYIIKVYGTNGEVVTKKVVVK